MFFLYFCVMEHFDNTICAPATASGGAMAVIRISGLHAIRCVDRIFKGRTSLAEAQGYSMHFGSVIEADGSLLDEVVVSVFRAPRSYTGENAVEIACHGSEYIVSRILALLLQNGAKMAAPGEFTQRAFLHGKMDLSQAEAVADLIAAQTAAAHRIALKQLKGGFSRELAGMRSELLNLASLMELELDFSEEEVEFADRSQLRELVEKVLAHCEKLIESFRLGNSIKNGVPVVIAGNTNSGKSTLLNALLGENRAIVSDIAGTTRDTIEETCNLDGVLFRFIDTAGLRESEDTIEQIGVERAYEKIAAAQLILAVLDLTQPVEELLASASDISVRMTEEQQLVFLLNKADAVPVPVSTEARRALSPLLASADRQVYTISAKDGIGLEDLRHALAATWHNLDTAAETSLVTNARHLEALQNAATALRRVQEGLGDSDARPPIPTDLLAQDLREALYHLGSITGEVSTDEILGNIFKNFCIGK
jgi:tRNA modification GTPase